MWEDSKGESMTFETAEEDETDANEPPVNETVEVTIGETDDGEPLTEEMAIKDAVRFSSQAVARPDSFGLVGENKLQTTVETAVEGIDSRVSQLRERIDVLQNIVVLLAAESDLNRANARCPDCNGDLQQTGKSIECRSCGAEMTMHGPVQ